MNFLSKSWRSGLLVILALSILLLISLATKRMRIDLETFEHIDVGLTEAEVERMLGAPAGWYASPRRRELGRLLRREFFSAQGVRHDDGFVTRGWASDDGLILVTFDREGKVSCKEFNWIVAIQDSCFS